MSQTLRQLASTQKRLASDVRETSRDESKGATVAEIRNVARTIWKQENDDPGANPPSIELSATGVKPTDAGEAYVFSRAAVITEREGRHTAATKAHESILEEKLKAIAQILASFGLLDRLSKRKQEALLKAIFKILETSDAA